MLLRLFSFLLLATTFAAAQFGSFFEQMFQGGDDHDHQHHHHQQNDVPSDSAWFQKTYNGAHCSKYLCPNTLACVDKPLHCPCAFDKWEVKFEVQDGLPLCLSKSGHPKMTEKKVELARKGLL